MDSAGSHARSFLSGHPDNPITETGVRSEFTHHGAASRLGRNRADAGHHALDPLIVAGPWVLAAGGVGYVATKLVRSLRRR